MARFWSDKVTHYDYQVQYEVLSADGWQLTVEHRSAPIARDDFSVVILYMDNVLNGRTYNGKVFEIQSHGTNDTNVIFATKKQLCWGMVADSIVENLTGLELNALIRRKNINNYNSLTSSAPIIACQAIPVEVREWLLINGADTLGNELKEARRAIRKSIKSGFAAINNKPTGKA